MTRPIEAVVAEALERLERSGRLDVAAYAAAYPEHAAELNQLLPAMLTVHEEKRWQKAEAESRSFAVNLFAQLAETPAAAPATGADTVGALFARDRAETGLTLEEQARRTGLPANVLEQLTRDGTPVDALDNTAIKQLAARVAAPFAALLKEVRRLVSLESVSMSAPAAVFTRDKETSTEAEQKALLDKVREAAGRGGAPPADQVSKPGTPPEEP